MLSSFPHLTDSEFTAACQHLLQRFQLHGHKQESWTSVEMKHQSETPYLEITKPLQANTAVEDKGIDCDTHDEDSDEEADSDEETLFPPPPPNPQIHYTIHLSPTYRVPVLHLHIQDALHRYPPTMTTLTTHLIPAHSKPQIDSVSIMGGVTLTHHPVTGRPVFVVHPCRTAEVMEAAVGRREVSGWEYLMVWIGALGGSVGLHVPVSLVVCDQGGGNVIR